MTAGCVVEEGKVVRAAPILKDYSNGKKFVGMTVEQMKETCKKLNWKVISCQD
jgi:hypothetical protein